MPVRSATYLFALWALFLGTILPTPARAQTSSSPRLGSTRAMVAQAWQFDPLYGTPKCKSSMCNYASGPLHLLVYFDSASRVTDIQMFQYPNPGQAKYWHMLMGFLPVGAHKQSCRRFTHTGGLSGPARACTYRWHGHTILIAQWLHENPLQRGGWVDMGMNFYWLQHF